jgi:hypothetical protein
MIVARFLLDDAERAQPADSASALADMWSRLWRARASWAGIAAAVVVSALVAWMLKPAPQEPRPVTRFDVPLAEDVAFSNLGRHVVAVSPDGSHVESGKLIGVPVKTTPEFETGTPTVLFESPFGFASGGRNYDVSLDGRRILILKRTPGTDQESRRVVVVQHFDEQLKRLVPTR